MSTDNTTQPLDVAALRALLDAATPAPWRAMHDENWLSAVWFTPYSCYSDISPAHADLIAAMRNQLPALLSELAKVTAERDEARRKECSALCRDVEEDRDHWKKRYAELENALNWNTTCLGCSQTLDGAYVQTMRAETAEAELVRSRQDAEYWKSKYEATAMDQLATPAAGAGDGEPYYQPCGCLTNDSNAHRSGCPDWRTVKGEHGQAIRWVKRAADSGEVGS